jgi:hypothetical protein
LLAIAVLLVRPGSRRRWLPGFLVIGALLGVTLCAQLGVEPAKEPDGTLAARPGDDSREINMFNSVFRTIVDGRHDTLADLGELGLPASFAQYAGNGWWDAHPATADPLYPRYRGQLSRRNVAAYFAHHPGRAVEVLNQAATDLLTARPGYLGSFDASAGFPPHAQEYRLPVLSWLTGRIAPLGLFALIPLWLLAAVRAWWQRRTLGVVLAFLLAVAMSQFVTAAFGDGIEGIKHQAVALFATALALVLGSVPARRLAGFRDVVGDLVPPRPPGRRERKHGEHDQPGELDQEVDPGRVPHEAVVEHHVEEEQHADPEPAGFGALLVQQHRDQPEHQRRHHHEYALGVGGHQPPGQAAQREPGTRDQ